MSIPQGAASPSPAADENKIVAHDWDDVEYDDQGNIIPPSTTETSTTTTNNTDPGQTAAGTTTDGGSPATQNDSQNLAVSAGELLLRRNGFETNMVQYGDEEVDFTTLTPEEQADILGQLYQQEQTNDLSPEALRFDQLLKNGLTPQQVAEQLLGNGPELSDDDLHLQDIRKSFPNLTEEQQQQELEDRKNGRLYQTKTEQLRAQLEASKPTLEQLQAQQAELDQAEFQRTAQTYVQAAAEVQEIDGSPVTDDIRNFLLGDMVELEANGQSRFVNLVEDPKNMFRLAYYDRFMPQILSSFNEQLAAAEERGRQSVLGNYPTKPITTDAGVTGRQQAPAATPRKNTDPNFDPMVDSVEDFGG